MKTVAVLGLGYVGFPLAELLAKSGKYRVIGLDISEKAVARARQNLKHKNFRASADFSLLRGADISVVCVPTPVKKNYEPDYGPVEAACRSIAKNLKSGQLIIIESTVNPGTCEEIVMPILERFMAKAGQDFFLAHCPERIDPGNKKWTLANIPRNIGGLDQKTVEMAAAFYRSFLKGEIKVLKSLKSAEATKIVENTFRDINIAYVNELAMSFDKLGIDLLEVIEGAKTKPFAFMPHYPGVGVGGHCFEKNQVVFVKTINGIETLTLEELYKKNHQDVHFEKPKILSFDLKKQTSCFKKLLLVSKRKSHEVIRFHAKYGYELKVTDLHPVIVQRNNELITIFAKDIRIGDQLVINRFIPTEGSPLGKIDVIDSMKKQPWDSKMRISLKNSHWEKWRKNLMPVLKNNRRAYDNYYRYNFLPFNIYLKAEQQKLITSAVGPLAIKTGRGPSMHSFPSTFKIDKDFCRLIGYYLSEGCLTTDKSARVRFSFHAKEHEYLRDVRSILRKKEIPFSEYHSRQWQSSCIKVSSNIFGHVIQNILGCGTDCYSMNVPPQLFSLPRPFRKEIVKGLLRGDGGVETVEGKRLYRKNGKLYLHENNSANVNYFSSSKKLFQQMVALLLDQNMFPKINKRDGLLFLHGPEDIDRVAHYFDGEKKSKLARATRNRKKIILKDKQCQYKNFLVAPITSIETIPTDYVYSAEVEETHTIVTSYGIVVHNCIPVDPYYLIERALKSGFEHYFLEMARSVNNNMPAYTVSLLEDQLKKIGKKLRGAQVALLGLAYKKDIADLRESPALNVLNILKQKGARVITYDPFLPKLSSAKNLAGALKHADAMLLATAHTEFIKKLTPAMLKKSGVKIVIDGRNCLSKETIQKAGVLYKGIGH